MLITLGIIGVVAAMTIPTLMNRTNDKELVSGTYFDYRENGFGQKCDKTEPCTNIVADINGKKGPNKYGKDIYGNKKWDIAVGRE